MPGPTVTRSVEFAVGDGAVLLGDLVAPRAAREVVVFAHGTGSGRHSPRNRMVAAALQERGFGTLLLDLLTAEEEATELRGGRLRFDIDVLAGRLARAAEWLTGEGVPGTPIGYFGASTGAAAALVAAARQPEGVAAVVSRGGRPDLAGDDLARVQAPTLLIVGGEDRVVLAMNREAFGRLQVERRLEIVPGATHLFEEPGTLERVAELAGGWFDDHLTPSTV